MGGSEPRGTGSKAQPSSQGSRPHSVTVAVLVAICCITTSLTSEAKASAKPGSHWNIDSLKNQFNPLFQSVTGWNPARTGTDLLSLVKKAEEVLVGGSKLSQFEDAFGDDAVDFVAQSALGDSASTTVRFAQTYKGIEVVGDNAMVHFDANGNVGAVTGTAIMAALDTEPALTRTDALKILVDRYQEPVRLSSPAKLKVLRNFDGKVHLTYHMLTATTPSHDGQEVYVDAHNGTVVLEFDRAYHADRGSRTVYSADTDAAREGNRVDFRGYPTDINFNWYSKVVEDGNSNDDVDRSAVNAYRNAGKVYEYYFSNFSRKSYDDRDARIVSVVHMGIKMNNAFWSNEYKVMGYGDGDGHNLTDLTYGLDVAAHEMTHRVTASSAALVYAAESGALNESFSDFFGKMVDYDGDWLIGARIMAPAASRRALRSMKNPEEFKQPGSNDSQFRKPTNVPCNRLNDRCGVHTNSGIPNRAAVLIVEGIGKEKAEQLYYRVLTRHLSATSTFKDARTETEKACKLMYGENSAECDVVTRAFDTVKM